MRIFIFALFVASCYASGPLDKVNKLPPAIVTKSVVLPQKTITVQRDIPVKAPPRLVTMTRPVPSVPKIVTIDKKVPVPSHPKIVTIHRQVPVQTQVVVPRPIPSPPRIITIERPVPVPQTVIVDKPYLVPTPVIIPRPVPVWVDAKSAPVRRGPINLQPIIAGGPLPRPVPTPLANPQGLITGKTSSGAITIGNLGGPIVVGDKVLEAPLLAPANLGGKGSAKVGVVVSGNAAAKVGSLAPLKPSSKLPLGWEQTLLWNSDLALNPSNLNRPVLQAGKLQSPLVVKKPQAPRVVEGKLKAPHSVDGKLQASLLVHGNLGVLGAPLAPNQQWMLESGRPL